MAKTLPVTGAPNHRFAVTVGDSIFSFSIRWIERTQGWYCAIYNSDLSPVMNYEKLSPNFAVVFYSHPLFPDGNLFVVANVDEALEGLGRDNFGVGKSYELCFMSNEELATLAGG